MAAILLVLALFTLWVGGGVEGQGRPGLWEQYMNDPDRKLASPSLALMDAEERRNDPTNVWSGWWEVGGVGAHFPDILENEVIPTTTDEMQLAAPLWGNPPFFCIDIPKMLYEGYTVGEEDSSGDIEHYGPEERFKIDKFNEEGVGYETQQRRSKSRYLNAYSLFWIMEPTSYRWNRRFAFRINAGGNLGVPVDDLGWTTGESIFTPTNQNDTNWLEQSPFANDELDPYTDVSDGRLEQNTGVRFVTAMSLEREEVEDEGLYWHVEVTGIRDTRSTGSRVLKGWYHLKITLRKDNRATPVSRSKFSIDRLAVSARGLTFNHEFYNTGESGFHTKYGSSVDRYFGTNANYLRNRPHRVWEGGAGEFVRDFPKCKGVPDHKFVERQFVPCGTTGKNQWYYGNNFMLVKTDYPGYPDKSGMYGGGVIVNGDHEEVHLNYKLDQSFCNMYLAVDFVVNGVVLDLETTDARTFDSGEWITSGFDFSFAVERSSSTRISFVVDDHVEDPQPIAQTCKSPKLPLRQFAPPIIKQGSLPELTFYGNADPILPGVEELDCFVTLKEFNASPNQSQPEESFHGAIQEILPPENFTSATPRGLTLTYWYLYILPWSQHFCNADSRGDCQTYTDFSRLISDDVKEWEWRKADPSDFSDLNPGPPKKRWELTQVPYLDGTFKGFWVSYFDWVGDGMDPYETVGALRKRLIRYGGDVAWPTSRQIGKDVDSYFNEIRLSGSIFQPLYFKPVPFVERATADKSHQILIKGVVPPRNSRTNGILYTPFSGEPGHSPPACDLYVSRYYLRILDTDDDQYYNKDVGFPNDPTDTCLVNTSRLTTDPALQYIRKVYVKLRNQTVGGVRPRPTWHEKYISFDYGPFCANVRRMLRTCPTMVPLPYTTPKFTTTEQSVTTDVPLVLLEAKLKGMTIDNPASLYIWDSRVIHGIWMTILAHFLFPLISLLDRFYGDAVLSGIRIYRVYQCWYNLRYILAIIIPPLIGIGLQRQIQSATILGTSYFKPARYHRKAGWLMVYVSLFIAIVWGTPLRKTAFFRQYGKLIKGYCTTVLKFFNGLCMFTSIFIPGSPSAEFDVSDVKVSPVLALKEYFIHFLILWVMFDGMVLVSMIFWETEIHVPKEPEGDTSSYRISPMPALHQHFQTDYKIRRRKTWTLRLYLIVTVIMTISLSTYIAESSPFLPIQRGFAQMACTHDENGTVRETFPKKCPVI